MAETVAIDKSGSIGGLLITNADKVGAGIGSIIGAATGNGGGAYYNGSGNSFIPEPEPRTNIYLWLGIGGAVLALVLVFFFLNKK